MASVVQSFSIEGVDGYVVEVEIKTISGQPMFSIVGLGDTAVKEAKERLEAVLSHKDFNFPQTKIVINLAPSNLKKRGSHFDLAMAIGLLIELGQIEPWDIYKYGFIGELSLNGWLRPCTGVLPMVMAAKEANIKDIIVPIENMREASLVKGVNIYGFSKLKEVTDYLEGKKPYQIPIIDEQKVEETDPYSIDFRDVQGQDALIEYIVVAASGGHNMLMIGAPGCDDYEVMKYRQKISGPILDRMDIQKYVQPVDFMELSGYKMGKSSKDIKERVESARKIQQKRYEKIEYINCNAQMTPALIKEYCSLEDEGKKLLRMAYDRFQYSARTFHKFLKVARTFADMEESKDIRKKDIAAALLARDLDKEQANMLVI